LDGKIMKEPEMKRATRLTLFLVGTFLAVAAAAWAAPARAADAGAGLDGGAALEPGPTVAQPQPVVPTAEMVRTLKAQCKKQAPAPCIISMLIGSTTGPEMLTEVHATKLRLYLAAAELAGAKGIVIGFLSPGGTFEAGASMFQAIKSEKLPVVCVAHLAMSSAFWIYQACPVRYVVPEALLLTHEVYLQFPASTDPPALHMQDLEDKAADLHRCNEQMGRDIAPRMQMSLADYLSKIHEGDWMIPAGKAVELHAADAEIASLPEAFIALRDQLSHPDGPQR
jgi:ATP-dependent protease ClpP protease subunit